MKIISDNPAYEPMLAKSEADELKVIGRVHYVYCINFDFGYKKLPHKI